MTRFFNILDTWGKELGEQEALIALSLLERKRVVVEWATSRASDPSRDMKRRDMWREDLKELFKYFFLNGEEMDVNTNYMPIGLVLTHEIDIMTLSR